MAFLRHMWQGCVVTTPGKRNAHMRKFGVVSLFAVVSCAPAVSTGGGTGGGTPSPSQTQARFWPVLTRLHVDLWLHGYAMLLRDTATVPVFRRGYREHMEALKAQRNIRTMLDANRDRLQQ